MRNKVYFISDLHLGARYIADAQAHEKRVVAWLESIRDHASALYLLGDILDYWYEYRYVVPKGHVRFLGVLARLVDAGVKVYWFQGNHDIWLFSYMQSEIGIEVVDGSRVVELSGKRFFLEHGDGVGHKSAGLFAHCSATVWRRNCSVLYIHGGLCRLLLHGRRVVAMAMAAMLILRRVCSDTSCIFVSLPNRIPEKLTISCLGIYIVLSMSAWLVVRSLWYLAMASAISAIANSMAENSNSAHIERRALTLNLYCTLVTIF